MKLPALWIVAAFAAGAEVAMHTQASLKLWVAAVVAAILVSGVLVWRERVAAAWAFALIAWVGLGGMAVNGERASVPVNHVTRLIAEGRLDLSEPLRWQRTPA